MKPKTSQILLKLLILTYFFLWTQGVSAQSFLPSIEYLNLLQQKLNPYFVYPPKAKTMGWEGIVKVKFTVAPDGKIKKIDVAESSGYPLLDAAAILAIKDASPYPFPQNYKGDKQELELILPVSYKLTKPLKPISSQETTTTSPVQISSAQPTKFPGSTKKKPKQKSLVFPPELTNFIDLAIKNNQPTQVARQEVELAQLKVTEAQRNVFPNLKISGYFTEGEVYKIDYEEEEAKFEVTQPLFYGGKFIDTIKQAKANLEINKKNYDRIKLDVIQKTETAYYNLISAKMDMQQRETLLKEAKDTLEKVEKLYEVNMVTPLEINSSRSWFKQLEFQIENTKQDLFMAELTFKQVLNIKESPQIETQQLLEAKELNLDLNTCLEVAYENRPEIYLSELLVKFNDYGKKIKVNEINGLTMDITSSYGLYKGHYQTEPWKDSTNWYAGIKVSKPWGGNTINTSYTKEETQPRYGQTSPTASSTMSAEFNLLDNFKRLTEKKKAAIDLHSSVSDFDETLKTITFEVQEALLNCQKAFLQLNAALTEMQFRSNALDVIKTKASVGEAELSSAVEMIFQLSEAQAKYLTALANYHISLSNLKKATGYGIILKFS